MNIIKGLIIKDLMNIKSYKSTMIILIVIFAISSFINNETANFFPMMITIVFAMVGISSFSYDNVSKADKYILSFATKKEIVKARYIYILLLSIIGAIVGFFISIILQLFKVGNILELANISLTILTAVLTMLVLQTIQIPSMYKFGAEKGRIVQMISTLTIIAVTSGAIVVLIRWLPPYSLDSVKVLMKYGYVIGIVVISLLYFISYKISYKIYLKKEF